MWACLVGHVEALVIQRLSVFGFHLRPQTMPNGVVHMFVETLGVSPRTRGWVTRSGSATFLRTPQTSLECQKVM